MEPHPHLLHWQVDFLPLSHLGSPLLLIYTTSFLELRLCQACARVSLAGAKTSRRPALELTGRSHSRTLPGGLWVTVATSCTLCMGSREGRRNVPQPSFSSGQPALGTGTVGVPPVRSRHLVSPLGAEQGTPGGRGYGQKPQAQIGIPAQPLTSSVTLDEHLAQAGFIIIRPPQAGGPHPDLQPPGCIVQCRPVTPYRGSECGFFEFLSLTAPSIRPWSAYVWCPD